MDKSVNFNVARWQMGKNNLYVEFPKVTIFDIFLYWMGLGRKNT